MVNVISSFFNAVFYNPIYNGLVALVAIIPGGDVGIAIIIITIIIRLVLLPFSLSAARAQRAMKMLEPKLKELKELHKEDKEKQALATWALYREAKVNPFAGFLTLLVQLPVVLALYWVFVYEPFSAINMARLYSFTPIPDGVSMEFLGMISVAGKSIVLAFLAGATQYFQAHYALKGLGAPSGEGMQADFQRVMGFQLKYVFPVIIAVVAYTTSGAVALYLITTNIAGVIQEIYVARKFASKGDMTPVVATPQA
jgi:YidC/Oxa1 family membrane protein insertase